MAAMSLSNIVKTSLGPLGLDKMLVDDIGVSLAGSIWVWKDFNCKNKNALGCDNHERRCYHPQTIGNRAPGCEDSCRFGRTARPGGRRWYHLSCHHRCRAAEERWHVGQAEDSPDFNHQRLQNCVQVSSFLLKSSKQNLFRLWGFGFSD